jgi:hypothetical protein
MNHLMPVHSGGSQPVFMPMPQQIARDSDKTPAANDIYVGHIPCEVDTASLHALFSQFGEVERIFEGNRVFNGGMKWAFVSYIHPQDAAK